MKFYISWSMVYHWKILILYNSLVLWLFNRIKVLYWIIVSLLWSIISVFYLFKSRLLPLKSFHSIVIKLRLFSLLCVMCTTANPHWPFTDPTAPDPYPYIFYVLLVSYCGSIPLRIHLPLCTLNASSKYSQYDSMVSYLSNSTSHIARNESRFTSIEISIVWFNGLVFSVMRLRDI